MSSLTTQLITNVSDKSCLRERPANNTTNHRLLQVQMVSAFEQSLTSMTARLNQMSLAAEHKDREIQHLKSTIDSLRKECTLHKQLQRRDSSDAASNGDSDRESGAARKLKPRSASRERDADSTPGWLRGSITRAFRKSRPRHKVHDSCFSDVESSRSNLAIDTFFAPTKATASPKFARSKSTDENEADVALRNQLMQKDRELVDTRLEALTMAHKMDNMREEMKRMKLENEQLSQENRRLHRLIQKHSLAFGNHSSANNDFTPQRDKLAAQQHENDNEITDPLVNRGEFVMCAHANTNTCPTPRLILVAAPLANAIKRRGRGRLTQSPLENYLQL